MSSGHDVSDATRRMAEDLIHAIARTIDDDDLEEFPNYFLADGVYKVATQFNIDRGLPLALIYCTNRGMINDRILSLRKANVFQPHRYRHLISGIHVTPDGQGRVKVRSNYMVVRVMDDGTSTIFATGEYQDSLVVVDGAIRVRERLVTLDSRMVETLLVIPV